MEEVDTPIDAGAKYIDTGSNSGNFVRVVRIWVGEDLTTLVKFHQEHLGEKVGEDTLPLTDFVSWIDGNLKRVNSEHRATIWRDE